MEPFTKYLTDEMALRLGVTKRHLSCSKTLNKVIPMKKFRNGCGGSSWGTVRHVIIMLCFLIGSLEISEAVPESDYELKTESSIFPVWMSQHDLTQPTPQQSSNKIVPGVNCTEPSIKDFPTDLFTVEELKSGAFLVHVVVSAYIFYAIAYLCEVFFVPSVESICKVLHIPADVAGATFMAIATSSPEFFTNVVGTFVTKGDIGVGSVVGSVVFNLLAIVSWCGLAVKDGLKLDWWPLTRDCGFYVFSVISLIGVLWDGRVYWYEALYFIIVYIGYIIVVCQNKRIQELLERFGTSRQETKSIIRRTPTIERLREVLVCSLSYDGVKGSSEITPLLNDKSGRYMLVPQTTPSTGATDSSDFILKYNSISRAPKASVASPQQHHCDNSTKVPYRKQTHSGNKHYALPDDKAHFSSDEVEVGLFEFPKSKSLFRWGEWVLGWPVRAILHLTIPDCRTMRYSNWYSLTFLMCIVYMAVFSYLITWMMTVIGLALRIPDAVMGLTFIAAGTSLPEALSSVIVARQGLGTMSISNSVGSNTFNILICLGLPWLIRTCILSSSGLESFIPMTGGAFGYVSIFLIVSALILYGLIACNGFCLDYKIGIVALVMYFVFLVLASLLELNFFFPVNLPTCGLA